MTGNDSWAGRCIYRVTPEGEVTVHQGELDAPADIGYDAKRDRILLPWFQSDRFDVLAP